MLSMAYCAAARKHPFGPQLTYYYKDRGRDAWQGICKCSWIVVDKQKDRQGLNVL